jgi:hypothetical protein
MNKAKVSLVLSVSLLVLISEVGAAAPQRILSQAASENQMAPADDDIISGLLAQAAPAPAAQVTRSSDEVKATVLKRPSYSSSSVDIASDKIPLKMAAVRRHSPRR